MHVLAKSQDGTVRRGVAEEHRLLLWRNPYDIQALLEGKWA
jgi:hypothetical protein